MLKLFFKIVLFIVCNTIIFSFSFLLKDIDSLLIFNSLFILISAILFHIIFFGSLKKITSGTPNYKYIFLGVLFIIILTPFWNFLTNISSFFLDKYPIFVDNTSNFEKLMLSIIETRGIHFNIFVIAFLPAICEEIFFRGTIQKMFSEKINIHLSIFITSVIFSIVHLNAKNTISIILISIILGYSFQYGKSIIIPISIHFINNLVSLSNLYIEKENFFVQNTTSTLYAVISIIVSLLIIILLRNKKII